MHGPLLLRPPSPPTDGGVSIGPSTVSTLPLLTSGSGGVGQYLTGDFPRRSSTAPSWALEWIQRDSSTARHRCLLLLPMHEYTCVGVEPAVEEKGE